MSRASMTSPVQLVQSCFPELISSQSASTMQTPQKHSRVENLFTWEEGQECLPLTSTDAMVASC